MATEGPLSIEAPKQDPSYIVNENKLSVVPVPNPGPVIPSKGLTDTVTQQPVGVNTFNLQSDKKEIPQGFQRPATSPSPGNPPPSFPSNTVLTVGEQHTRRENVRTKVEAETLGSGAVHEKHTRQYVQEIKHEKDVCMQDEHGNMRKIKLTILEQHNYTEICEVLVKEAKKINLKNSSNRKALPQGEEDFEADATCSEKTVDLCCQSLVCHFQNPFRKNATAIQKNQLMNATRRRGRAKGWTILKGLIFPFVSDVAREIWVSFQLIYTLVLFCLSISIFTLAGRNFKLFHAIHLGFSALAAFLAILDCIVNYSQCTICKACISYCRRKAGKEASLDINEIPSSDRRMRCRKCFVIFRSGLDIARLLLIEYIFVPIIFCDMFEVATGKGFNSDVIYHRIGFALMVYDSIGLIVFVFLLRLVILGRMIRKEQRAHPTKDDADINKLYSCKNYNIDWSIKKNSQKILIVFNLHVIGQTLAHVLMLVAVGAKIAYDNRLFSSDQDEPSASPYLWYMMAAAYILPTIGIGTFFIVNNYWVQQFLIGLCIDFTKVLRIMEDNKPFFFGREAKPSEMICKFVRINKLETEYKNMRKVHFCDKVNFPFKSPGLAIVCMLYAAGQCAFVLCSIFAIDDMSRFTVVFLNGGGWIFYVVVATVMGAIVNICAFLVALIWLLIIVLVIAALALLVMGCVCLALAAGSDN